MSTTPEPASPEPTPRSDVAAESTDTARPPVDETETEATESPETPQVDEASTSRDEPDESPTDAQDRSESDSDPDTDSDSETEPVAADDSKSASDAEADSKDEGESDEERQRAAEEFAAEHDPTNHDIAAGEEFRQPGDWTAEDGGPQVWDSEGNLISEGDEGDDKDNDSESDDAEAQDQPSADSSGNGGRRVSELEEVRDGGYSVGSAATIHDGAMPFGHPVKAWEDTKTFVTEDHDHYEEAEPHVWFADADAAQRAGFQPAD